MEQKTNTLSQDQIINLDEFLQSNKNEIYKCPNHLTKRVLEAHENGIRCTRCDYKVPTDSIPSQIKEIL